MVSGHTRMALGNTRMRWAGTRMALGNTRMEWLGSGSFGAGTRHTRVIRVSLDVVRVWCMSYAYE